MARTLIGNFKGPKGDRGEKGEKGDTGATGPRGATGESGSIGQTGKRGSRWSKGTAMTGTSTTATVFSGSGISDALVDDMYLNTSTQNVYQCTVAGAANVAKWIYCCNLKGAAGGKGDKGEKGDTGNRGEKGDSGPRGLTGDAAGFGTPEAVIDAGTGTPSVTVTASGPATAKIFKFVFKNLVGKQGPAGDVKTSVLMTETDYTTMWNTIKS